MANKPFEFKSAEKLTEIAKNTSDYMARLQEQGIAVNMDEPLMQAGFEIAAQLSGIREELRAIREPELRWYRPNVLLPDTHRDVIVVTREQSISGKKIVSTGWYDGEKWRGIGEMATVQQWTEKPL